MVMARQARGDMRATVRYEAPVRAPVEAGTPLGEIVFTVPGVAPRTYTLVAGQAVPELGFFGKAMSGLSYLLLGD